ncbi:hypothetical protein FLONG3_451 [Fusarium longipes]|uniref:Uncharacterized protein n=1 Tax=Fusarium longipes TaxID=694270 RepID=A0A395T9X4_9HYPO|nr:hypothetical protein FLONG3_451 [Fusarium longipes]
MQKNGAAPWRLLFIYPLAILAFLAFISFYVGSWSDLGLTSHSGIIESRIPHPDLSFVLAKRSVAYDKAINKGRKLHCLMGMTQEEAKQANGGTSLESPDYLQIYPGLEEFEGWDIDAYNKDAPWFKRYLDDAFHDLGIEKKFHHEAWEHSRQGRIYDDPLDPDIDAWMEAWPSRAFYYTSYIIDAGVIIGDNAKSVKHGFQDEFSGFEEIWEQHMTRIRQSQITNEDTLGILTETLLKWRDTGGRGVEIGKWEKRITLDVRKDDDKEAFYAFLGSPHGAMSSYLLLNHKEKLGVKTINKVDIFVPNIPVVIIGESVSDTIKEAKISCVFYVTTV